MSFQKMKNIAWIVVIILVAALVISVIAVWSLARGQARLSTALFTVVSPVPWTLSRATGQSISSLEVWDEGVWLGKTAGQLWLKTQAIEGGTVQDRVTLLTEALPQITAHNRRFTEHFSRSWLLNRVVRQHAQVTESLGVTQALLEVINASVTNQARYLVLLQNTDEVRATGGFMGSYTLLDFGAENLLSIQVRDIYDPSGVSITLPSPPGQQEYLSEGKGLKLVDANWDPDFPLSAAQILEYFAQIKDDSQQYDGVIAVPLSVVEKLLTAIDGVYLPDQQQTVTAEMFADTARQDRQSFFPGSQNKTQALESFYTALLLKLGELSLAEWERVIQALLQNQLLPEIQLFAQNPAVQQQIERAQLDGALEPYSPDEFFLFPVESNVGINKANRKVSRNLTVNYDQGMLRATVKFQNAYTIAERPFLTENPAYDRAPHLSYVNYYRLLVSPNLTMQSIQLNGKLVPSWDEAVRVSSHGLPYIQLGFLAVVPETAETEVTVYFAAPDTLLPKLKVQKQVGLEYGAVVFSCFNNTHHSPLYLIRKGLMYQDTCGKQVQ